MCVVWTWRVHGRTSQHKLPAAAARRHKRTAPSNQPPVVVAQTGHRDTHATRDDARRAQRQPSSSVSENTCARVSDDADDDEDDNNVQVDSVDEVTRHDVVHICSMQNIPYVSDDFYSLFIVDGVVVAIWTHT